MELIEIGTVLHLELNAEDNKADKEKGNNEKDKEKEVLRYKCRLVDVAKNMLLVDHPIDEKTGKSGFFYDGTEFEVWFVGKDGAVYSFKTHLIGKKKHNIPIFVLKDPGKENYMRTQRRNYVRIETSIDVAIHPKTTDFKPFTTYSLDISGGGLAISIPITKQLPGNGEAYCYLALPMMSGEIHYIKSVCNIVRVFRKDPKAREQASLQFESIGEQDRQKVIRYCFERQLADRKQNEKR